MGIGYNAEKKLFLSDYDDTFAPNLHDYTPPMIAFMRYILKNMNGDAPSASAIMKIEDEIDTANVKNIDPTTGKPFMYTARRFPTTMQQAYQAIASNTALAPNTHRDTEERLEFVEYAVNTLGPRSPNVPTILKIIEEKFQESQKHYSDKKEAFYNALQQSIEYIAEGIVASGHDVNMPENYPTDLYEIAATAQFDVNGRHNRQAYATSPEQLEELWEIGNMAFDENHYKRQGLFPGAEKTLDFLASTGDKLVLLTKGEKWVQERKINATGIKKWFGDDVRIVPTKDKDVLLSAMSDYGFSLKNTWHIGNSIPSDVKHAKAAGIGMLYVPFETWSHEMDHNGLDEYKAYPRFVLAEELTKIRELYPTLAGK